MTGYDGGRFAAPGFDQSRQPRGNVTQVSPWIGGEGQGAVYISSYSRYDNAGNVVATKTPSAMSSPSHVVATVSYVDDFGDGTNPGANGAGPNGATFAFPTLMTNALGHQVKTQYSYTLGAVTGVRDANQIVTKTEYDQIGRTIKAIAAFGLAEQVVGEMSYPTATENVARASKQLDGTRWHASKTEFDGFDRPVLSASAEDGRKAESAAYTILTKTVYDELGRVKLVTNPYRQQPAETDGWTRMTYDLGGRVTEVATFAGGVSYPPPDTGCAAADGCTGTVVTTYDGERTTVRDQANKQRRSAVDGLGRLASVEEMSEYPSTFVYAATTYDYDARGNLKGVHQGGQTRAFAYDGLSRLKSAVNPEACLQGETGCAPVPVTYDYYANGSLSHKRDARGIITTYTYDAVNRPVGRSYTDSTPPVSYCYDSQSLPVGAPAFDRGLSTGRLVGATYGGGSLGSYTGGFDAMGRPRLSHQVTDTGTAEGVKTYKLAYEYDLAGNLISEQYPSGRVVKTKYDAAGRVAGVKHQAGGHYYAGDDPAVADNPHVIAYTAGGVTTTMRLGNGLWEQTAYNSRLQPTRIGLGTSISDSSVLRLDYAYGSAVGGTPDQTKNNGNLLRQTITAPGLPTPLVQTYAYDAVNRLQSAEEQSGATTNWRQVYSYDRYGNRRFGAGTTWPDYSQTPNDPATGLPVDPARNPVFDPSNNRIKVTAAGQGEYGYDAAGNLLCEPGRLCTQGQSSLMPYYAYDAENKMRSAAGGYEGGGTSYTYDGDGRRVKKATYSGEVTVFVYDAVGRAVAEYSNQVEYKGTRYLTQDHLGSIRVVTDSQQNAHSKNGAGGSRHDYLPFGEEVGAGVGGRTQSQGYVGSADGTRQRFVVSERDNETGLDYMQARYYGSTMGRFTSADPVAMTVDRLYDPQQINLYAYTRNNPLAFIDPTGEIIDYANKDSRKAYDEYEKFLNTYSKKYASELATLNQLKNSDVTYVIKLGEKAGSGEGELTTDGSKIFINLNNVGGSSGETFSFNSRFAHELEHGRQFDNGELTFLKGSDGKWQPSRTTYDIGDEVKAFKAQQNASIGADYFKKGADTGQPSLLRDFANAKTDDERAGVLARSAYPNRNPRQNSDFVYAGKENYKPGQLVRTNDSFGRVNRVVQRK
jgi:RHS repeat-associated protein